MIKGSIVRVSSVFVAFFFLKVAQLCPTLCDPVDYIVHGILQARILEWVAFPLRLNLLSYSMKQLGSC